MGFDVVERMTVLERERGRLDRLLASDENWRTLLQLEALETEGQPLSEVDAGALKAVLLKTLEASRIYRARRAILEAITLLHDGFGPLPAFKTTAVAAPDPPAAPEPVVPELLVPQSIAPEPIAPEPAADTFATAVCATMAGAPALTEPVAANENSAPAAVSIVHAIIVGPAISADTEPTGEPTNEPPGEPDNEPAHHDFGSDAIDLFIDYDEAAAPEFPAPIDVSPTPEPAALTSVKHPIVQRVANLEHEPPLVPDPEEADVTIVSTRVPVQAAARVTSVANLAQASAETADPAALDVATARPRFGEASVEIVRTASELPAALSPIPSVAPAATPTLALSDNASRFLRALNGA